MLVWVMSNSGSLLALSGGESQRVKLASFLSMEMQSRTIFIFDEPTTGLHFHDIKVFDASNECLDRKRTYSYHYRA